MSSDSNNPLPPDKPNQSKLVQRLKALGVVGFLFFLIKGLIWLFVLYFAGKGCV
jgi:hypothetical protein